MSAPPVIIKSDWTEANTLMDRTQRQLMGVLTSSLFQSCKAVVNEAKMNAQGSMQSHSSNLLNSLKVLAVRPGDTSVEVDVGSDLPGYPFFQEMGWTTKTGTHVKPKLFFARAVWSTQAQVLSGLIEDAGKLAAGSITLGISGGA